MTSQTQPEDIVSSAQVIRGNATTSVRNETVPSPHLCRQSVMSCKPEGDAKLQELSRRVQSVCSLDIDEPKKQELQQQMRRAEEQWMSITQTTRRMLDQAERQRTLNVQMRDFETLSETTRTWLEDKRRSLELLDSQTDPEKAINDTQVSLRRQDNLFV